jgi:hypothetical protein
VIKINGEAGGVNGRDMPVERQDAVEHGHAEILFTEPLRKGVRNVIGKPVAPGEMVKNA